ncbi:MAG: NAD(P)/FAD-dependent oxidoreductase [Candidatus Abawacabacteria bacterium]|nr:NAD(P)/FAD-dependent oxidoreductase [Candidatus Abawacabacteria bacterium]
MGKQYDVVICGASFGGITLALHLGRHLKVLLIDRKPVIGSQVESTGLITEHTRQIFAQFFDIDRYITNPITSIAVIATNFKNHFISETDHNWIYQTDTRNLVRALADSLPENVTVLTGCSLQTYQQIGERLTINLKHKDAPLTVETKFLVGADGGHSKVAESHDRLSKNRRFLFGIEQVYLGEVLLGKEPEKTIYHFWFGEFSLGYGGWLSPTIIDGKKAFRIGLAKLFTDEMNQSGKLLQEFVQKLLAEKIIAIDADNTKPVFAFGSGIPIAGPLKKIIDKNVMLIGDAAGLCGAFAADGIKGAIVSGIEGAKLIEEYFQGKSLHSKQLHAAVNNYNQLMAYFHKQLRYRWIWDQMKRNDTFDTMFKVIEAEKNNFLQQFCDSKDRRRSLIWTVLKAKHCIRLAKYSILVLRDMILGKRKSARN